MATTSGQQTLCPSQALRDCLTLYRDAHKLDIFSGCLPSSYPPKKYICAWTFATMPKGPRSKRSTLQRTISKIKMHFLPDDFRRQQTTLAKKNNKKTESVRNNKNNSKKIHTAHCTTMRSHHKLANHQSLNSQTQYIIPSFGPPASLYTNTQGHKHKNKHTSPATPREEFLLTLHVKNAGYKQEKKLRRSWK